jgi:hypothetical protein
MFSQGADQVTRSGSSRVLRPGQRWQGWETSSATPTSGPSDCAPALRASPAASGSAVSRLKGGVCVSTVSIVGCLTANVPDRGHGPAKSGRQGVADSPAGGGGGRPNSGSIIADSADRADGIFESCAHPDDPASGSAFTTERNVDAQCPQERLRTTQPPGERARISWPACGPPGGAITGKIGGGMQKV